jgi:hypothetical protein
MSYHVCSSCLFIYIYIFIVSFLLFSELYPKLEALASAHLTLTIGALAAGLPLYDVRFGEEEGDVVFTVKQLNTKYDDEEEEEAAVAITRSI